MNEFKYQELLQNGALEIVDYFVSDDLWISFPDKFFFIESYVNEFEKYLFVCQRVGNVACTHVFIYTYVKSKLRSDINARKKAFKSILAGGRDRGNQNSVY